ncbi:MAG: hypothetical protein Q9166_001969 [cf. Caloplaca sp. 2 TL-2023]
MTSPAGSLASSEIPELPNLPNFLFNGWHLRRDDISQAHRRDELKGWTVSSLCSAYLEYQLVRHERQLIANPRISAPSLASTSVKTILENLRESTKLQENVKSVFESLGEETFRYILQDPRTPYVVLRKIDALPETTIQGTTGIRKPVDIDEAVLASEHLVRSQKPNPSSSFLVTLKDLEHVLGSPDADGITTFRRKTPPKGGFEFLYQKRKQKMRILGTDARWKYTFDHVTNGCLEGLDWKNVFIAGGVVLNTLLHTDNLENDSRDLAHKDVVECDIDLYLYDLTPAEANHKVEHIYKIWYQNTHSHGGSPRAKHQMVVKTAKTITFIPKYPIRRIQIVLNILPSPLDILLKFDLDACAIGFDGKQVLMLPRCARAIETGYNVFTMDLIWGHHLGNRRESQEVRVFKYADRGFGMRILPSYVQSLEDNRLDESQLLANDIENSRSGPTRIFKGEPGLKTLRRVAFMGQEFVQRRYFGKSKITAHYCNMMAQRSTQYPPSETHGHRVLISLAALDGYEMHDGLPDNRKSLGVFELLMRHCEAWRMDAIGIAHLDRNSFPSISYDENNQYDGLPTYEWSAHSAASFEQFQTETEEHNNRLFWILRKAIAEKLNIGPRDGRYIDYLTRRIRRVIVGPDLDAIREKQITMPLIIPMDLEVSINNELASRCQSAPKECLPQLIQVHDPSKYDPGTATVPSLSDTTNDSGNLRYWLVTNDNMWAGQHRAMDEVTELLTSLFDWFLRCEEQPDNEPIKHGADNCRCIWHLAKAFRRRLALPEVFDSRERGQTLPIREIRLFRPWAFRRPARVKRSFVDDVEEIDKLEDELAKEGDIPDSAFWDDRYKGTWNDEQGVPFWTE